MTPFSDSKPVSLSSPVNSSPPDDSERDAKNGVGCLIAVAIIIGLVGLWLFFSLFLKPIAQVVTAANWPTVPCRIASSVLSTHSDSDGTTYSADIVYTYIYGGQTYTSGRYSFASHWKGKYQSKADLVARYPAGSLSNCYVNPSDPSSAVLNRDYLSDIWTGLIGIPFIIFGLVGITSGYHQRKALTYPNASWKPKSQIPNNGQPVVLRAQSSPLARFVGITAITTFWNGCLGMMTWEVVIKGEGGRGFSILTAIFFIPFFLAGLYLLVFWIQSFLVLGNARPILTLSPGALRVGQIGELLFDLRGGLFLPLHIEVSLEGREEATFRRGTDSITSTSTFYFQTLAHSTETRGNRCTLTIPSGTMHSMETPHNKILWILRVRGPLRFWPDISEEWRIQVEPAIQAPREQML